MNTDLNIDSKILDSAFAQNLITINEFREMIGLKPIENGDRTKNGKTLEENWSTFNHNKN